jgi:hypothetical protein
VVCLGDKPLTPRQPQTGNKGEVTIGDSNRDDWRPLQFGVVSPEQVVNVLFVNWIEESQPVSSVEPGMSVYVEVSDWEMWVWFHVWMRVHKTYGKF